MSDFAQDAMTNRLLKMMPAEGFERIRPHLKTVGLAFRDIIVRPNTETTHVHFLESGIASIVTTADLEHEGIEVGHIGWEGMTAAHVILGSFHTPNGALMLAGGTALQMDASQFLRSLEDVPSLHWFLLRYVQYCKIQIAQSALAHGRYSVRERLARWLLMCHDRTDGDNLVLTHEFLAMMLGVRRTGVTEAIQILEGNRLIKATRGHLRILDRERILKIAGGCYGVPEREYEHLMVTSRYV